jgi:hypothetical protein
MSYDVHFCIDAGQSGEKPGIYDWESGEVSRNYTSNVGQMWAEAIGEKEDGEFMALSRVIKAHPVAEELRPFIERGVSMMSEAPEYFRQYNPPNGWGDYEGALEYLRWIAANCVKFPHAFVEVSS